MALSTMLVVMLAAMTSCATAEMTCGPCKCYDADHNLGQGLKVGECYQVSTLTSIQITNHKISQIEPGAFRYLTNVTDINLQNNEITELPSDFSTYTPNLTKIYLHNNKIKRLQTNMFSNLKYLKTVWLYNNEIITIEDHCFNNVPLLERIDLDVNKLVSLDVNFIDNVNSLKELHLFKNPWHCDASLCGVLDPVVRGAMWDSWPVPTCATPRSLTGRPWSEELQTELCPCFPCQCTVNPSAALCTKPRQLHYLATDLPTDLVQLNLTGQQIPLLKESDIIRYVTLAKLYLESNQIQNLQLSVFNNLTNLKILSLRNNSLTALKTHQFANLPLVSEIDVSRNNISLIEVDSFFNLPSLQTINLSRNKLKQLSIYFMDEPSKLKAVLLHGNPWRCDESMCELMDLGVRRVLWGAEEVPTCAAPADLRGKHWNRAVGLLIPEITSNTTSVVEGHNLELKCKHCFSPRLVWTFNDAKLPSSFVKVSSNSHSSTLIVKNVRKEQHGYYLCRVRSCEECEDDGLYVSVSGKPQSDFDVKQVLHVPGVNSSESCSSRSGILVLHYTVAPTIELNTTHSN